MDPILIIGANGQIGTELSQKLTQKFGIDSIILSDISAPVHNGGIFETLDILNIENIERIINKYSVKSVINLAAVLSAKGENNPRLTWRINVDGLINLLTLSVKYKFKIFQPSSIAVFGPDAPDENVPQNIVLRPTTMYGVTKVAGESLCNYYAHQYDVDVRSVRFPGVIGAHSMPGGGTTDYAVEIFHKAMQHEKFDCYLKADTSLPMIYMDDALDAILQIMSAPKNNISIRTSYNINSMSFSPNELYKVIKTHLPAFTIQYYPDQRQKIADTWPSSLADQDAKRDWGWEPKININEMVVIMLNILKNKYN